jgi:hypothetical protein
MEQIIAATAAWALVLLCVALYRGGPWRGAIPVADVAPFPPLVSPSPGEEEEPPKATPARHRVRPPYGLAGAVMATAALRLGLLVALGR